MEVRLAGDKFLERPPIFCQNSWSRSVRDCEDFPPLVWELSKLIEPDPHDLLWSGRWERRDRHSVRATRRTYTVGWRAEAKDAVDKESRVEAQSPGWWCWSMTSWTSVEWNDNPALCGLTGRRGQVGGNGKRGKIEIDACETAQWRREILSRRTVHYTQQDMAGS